MKQLEVTQHWNKTLHQLRADVFQIPLLHKYLYVVRQLKKPTPRKITENIVSKFRNIYYLCDV